MSISSSVFLWQGSSSSSNHASKSSIVNFSRARWSLLVVWNQTFSKSEIMRFFNQLHVLLLWLPYTHLPPWGSGFNTVIYYILQCPFPFVPFASSSLVSNEITINSSEDFLLYSLLQAFFHWFRK
jgi:hypothetical protein